MRFSLGIGTVYSDIVNYIDWIQTIKREIKKPKSVFNQHKMSRNMFSNIWVVLTLTDADTQLPPKIKRLRVVESLAPINRYIDEDLKFGEYIVPEFNVIQDDEGNETSSYVIVYRFAFKGLSLWWFLRTVAILSGIIYGLNRLFMHMVPTIF